MSWVLTCPRRLRQFPRLLAHHRRFRRPRLLLLPRLKLADLVGKSTSAIQAIELKKLDLSEELARKISLETEVALKWLPDGAPSVPPFTDDQPIFSDEMRNFSKAAFERGERIAQKPQIQPNPFRSILREGARLKLQPATRGSIRVAPRRPVFLRHFCWWLVNVGQWLSGTNRVKVGSNPVWRCPSEIEE